MFLAGQGSSNLCLVFFLFSIVFLFGILELLFFKHFSLLCLYFCYFQCFYIVSFFCSFFQITQKTRGNLKFRFGVKLEFVNPEKSPSGRKVTATREGGEGTRRGAGGTRGGKTGGGYGNRAGDREEGGAS